jgi:hypothetical protein
MTKIINFVFLNALLIKSITKQTKTYLTINAINGKIKNIKISDCQILSKKVPKNNLARIEVGDQTQI